MKATAIAHPNIALIKYWGKRDDQLFLPTKSSVSLTLEELNTIATVEFGDFASDMILINGQPPKKPKIFTRHLDLIRALAGIGCRARVSMSSNFPLAAGLAGSASAFSALTVATCAAAGLKLDSRRLSIISRQGSGSSCRSIYGGYVIWHKGSDSNTSYAEQIAPPEHLDIRDIIAIVARESKKVSSRAGMAATVRTCPIYAGWVTWSERQVPAMREAILAKDFTKIGAIAEADALGLHAVALTTRPPLIYWSPTTIAIMKAVQEWREEGLEAYFTIDAGPNVHVLCLPQAAAEVERRLKQIPGVISTIHCRPGSGVSLSEEHLF
jgi:diphosphomevalonate decarboxylase